MCKTETRHCHLTSHIIISFWKNVLLPHGRGEQLIGHMVLKKTLMTINMLFVPVLSLYTYLFIRIRFSIQNLCIRQKVFLKRITVQSSSLELTHLVLLMQCSTKWAMETAGHSLLTWKVFLCLTLIQEMHSETLIADPFKSTKEKKEKCRKKDARLPLAHLPISTSNDFSTSKYYAVNCDTFLQKIFYKHLTWHNLTECFNYTIIMLLICTRYLYC